MDKLRVSGYDDGFFSYSIQLYIFSYQISAGMSDPSALLTY